MGAVTELKTSLKAVTPHIILSNRYCGLRAFNVRVEHRLKRLSAEMNHSWVHQSLRCRVLKSLEKKFIVLGVLSLFKSIASLDSVSDSR
jgi:hypothetical protein